MGQAKGQCRACHRAVARKSSLAAYHKLSPQERYVLYRKQYLPRQLRATERKLIALRNEAQRLGMPELLSPVDQTGNENGEPHFPGGLQA